MTAALAMVLWLGCAARHEPGRASAPDPSQVVEALRRQDLSYALQGRFNLKVAGPRLSGSTTGAMVLHAPGQLRLQVFSPLKTPLFLAASDGRNLHLFDHDKGVFYRGDDAVGVLAELLGGGAGMPDVLALLTARLPLREARLVEASWLDRRRVAAALEGPEGLVVDLVVDTRDGLLDDLSVKAEGAPIFLAHYADTTRVRRTWLPEEMSFALPTLGWTLDVEVHTWDELGVVPDAFSISAPPGASERDLVEALRQASLSPE